MKEPSYLADGRERDPITGDDLTGLMEPCCECGEDYPRADLVLRHEIYCQKCRVCGSRRARSSGGTAMKEQRKGSPDTFGPISEPSVTVSDPSYLDMFKAVSPAEPADMDPPSIDGLPLLEAMDRASRREPRQWERRAIAAQVLASLFRGVVAPMQPCYRLECVAEAVRLADALIEELDR